MRKDIFRKGMVLAMICLFLGTGSVQKVISDNSIFRDTIIVPDDCSTIKETVYQTQISSGIFIGINGENDEELDDFVINYNDGDKNIICTIKDINSNIGAIIL